MSKREITAYCWRSGQIDFCRKGIAIPEGTLPIISGPERKLREIIGATARHAYDNETLLVPGVPEASSPGAALKALQKYQRWISPRIQGRRTAA